MSLNQGGKTNDVLFKCTNGEVVRLGEEDIDRWERRFDQIRIRGMLRQWSEESFRRPWLEKKTWFFKVSGYLDKLNKERDMPYETNGEIVLFPTREKRSEKSPDFTGTVEIHGNKYKLAAWTRKKGVISGTVGELADDRPAPLPKHENTTTQASSDNSDIPW